MKKQLYIRLVLVFGTIISDVILERKFIMIFDWEGKNLFWTNKKFVYLISIPKDVKSFQNNVQNYRTEGHKKDMKKSIPIIIFAYFINDTRILDTRYSKEV